MPDATPLPDDIAALKALLLLLLLQRDSEVQQLRSAVSTLEQALNVRTLEIEQLKLQIAKLKCLHFGRKSEKIDRKIEQLETRLEDLIAEDGAGEQERPATAAPARTKTARQPLPEHLPRDERIYEPTRWFACNVAVASSISAMTSRNNSKSSAPPSRCCAM